MAFIHGFRASELLDLRLSDIDASGKQLNIRRIKNGFSTTHPLLPDEYNLIKLWLKQRKLIENGVEGDWLFLIRNNNTIHWIPESIGKGRFGDWLENVQD